MLNVECRVGDLDSDGYSNGDITEVDHMKSLEWYKDNEKGDTFEVVMVYSNDDDDDDDDDDNDSERDFYGSCDDDSDDLDYNDDDLVYGGGADDFDKDNVVGVDYYYY